MSNAENIDSKIPSKQLIWFAVDKPALDGVLQKLFMKIIVYIFALKKLINYKGIILFLLYLLIKYNKNLTI